jgi:hypothetical protein
MEIEALPGPKTTHFDLGGRMVIPGIKTPRNHRGGPNGIRSLVGMYLSLPLQGSAFRT